MNGSDLLNAVPDAEEKYLSEAENISGVAEEFKKHRNKKIKAASVAAGCLVLAVAAAVVLRGMNKPSVLPDASSDGTSPATDVTVPDLLPAGQGAEMYQVPHWNELSELQRFGSAEYNGKEYSACGHEVAREYFGEELGTVELKGYDMYTDTEQRAEVTVFAVKDVSPSCAVGVSFADGVCTVYHDPWYAPATLGQFIEDCGLQEYAVFGKAYAEYFDAERQYHAVNFDDFDDAAVWEMLLSDTDAENKPDIEPTGDKLADVSVGVTALGIENLALWVTADGYLCTNVPATLKCFCIGEENTKAFADYLYANVPYSDEVPDFSAGDAGEPEAMTAAVNAGMGE